MSNSKGFVVQGWLATCSWKEQTTVLCGLRGPDAAPSPYIKAWVRWLRWAVVQNADNSDRFMQVEPRYSFLEIEKKWPDALNALPVHYLAHLMHALEIIGYRHDRVEPGIIAKEAYLELCRYLHVRPENGPEMEERLRDNV